MQVVLRIPVGFVDIYSPSVGTYTHKETMWAEISWDKELEVDDVIKNVLKLKEGLMLKDK
jgi:hypothetical protein